MILDTDSDRYEIVNLLAKGGMSTVYTVKDRKLNVLRAMKVISIDDSTKAEYVENEIVFLANLCHPSIPRIVDVCRKENEIDVVMDLVRGETLEEYAKRKGGLTETETIEFGKEILDVIVYLHSLKPPVIYRDLKPSNIMVCENKKISLIDFGIAMRAGERSSDKRFYVSKKFASPEIQNGLEGDERSDIYSFGRTVEAYCPKRSISMNAFIGRCTKEEPGSRFASATETKKAFESIKNMNDEYLATIMQKVRIFREVSFLSASSVMLLLMTLFFNPEKAAEIKTAGIAGTVGFGVLAVIIFFYDEIYKNIAIILRIKKDMKK